MIHVHVVHWRIWMRFGFFAPPSLTERSITTAELNL